MATATSRTLEYFRKLGMHPEVVERFIAGARIRKDFLSCIDILVLDPPNTRIIGVQAFTTAWTEHERKICFEYPEGARMWLSMGHGLYFFGWRRLKVKRGGKAVRWKPRIGLLYLTWNGNVRVTEIHDPWHTESSYSK